MRIEWINKSGNDRIVVFFNGWGMTPQAVSHLNQSDDLIVCYDYRNLSTKGFPSLEHYHKIVVVAWSMGVWAATRVLPELKISPSKLIALNGTEYPVNDQWGIPLKIYQLTEKGMNEQGRKKFVQRMFDTPQDRQYFEGKSTERTLEDVCEELVCIKKESTGTTNTLKWNKVYISEKDIIFPVQNQKNWWQERAEEIKILPGGHYPFYHFRGWEEIIED